MDAMTAAFGGLVAGRSAGLTAALAAGALTSVGPCVAPRYIALSALVGPHRVWPVTLAFTAGVATAYVTLGLATSLVVALVARASFVYGIFAVVLIIAGVVTLVRGGAHGVDGCARHPAGNGPSGAFAVGAASTLVISPCCTPLALTVGGLGIAQHDAGLAAAYLFAFALGHALPLLLLAVCAASAAPLVQRWNASGVPATVSGALTVALGAYYGLLA